MFNKKILAIVVFFILTFLGYVFLYHSPFGTQKATSDDTHTKNQALYTEHEGNNFLVANNILKKGPDFYPSARTTFEQSLADAQSAEQEAHIKYKIALTYSYEDPVKTVQLLKELVANPLYPRGQKAYALQHIYILYTNLVPDKSAILLPAIFEGAPYASFYTPNNLPLSFKNLNEYATSFGEAPISDAMIAGWYARSIRNLSATDAKLQQEYLTKAETHLTSIDSFIEKSRTAKNDDATLVPQLLILKASTYGELALGGVAKYRSLYGNAFADAVHETERTHVQDSLSRHSYAYYTLALKDTAEWDKARPLFDVVIQHIDKYSGMKQAYTSTGNPPPEVKVQAKLIAQNYPAFKDLLVSLGWKDADFN